MSFKIALNKINQYLINQKSVLLSVSGGLDSVVLLDIVNSEIKYTNLDIHILHVNYNTNKNSDLAEDLCLRLAKEYNNCLLYTSPSPRDRQKSRMPSSA